MDYPTIHPILIFAILGPGDSSAAGPDIIGFKVIKTLVFNYRSYDSDWMRDDDLGENCLVPDVDLADEEYLFWGKEFLNRADCENAALRKVAELYSSQIGFGPFGTKP